MLPWVTSVSLTKENNDVCHAGAYTNNKGMCELLKISGNVAILSRWTLNSLSSIVLTERLAFNRRPRRGREHGGGSSGYRGTWGNTSLRIWRLEAGRRQEVQAQDKLLAQPSNRDKRHLLKESGSNFYPCSWCLVSYEHTRETNIYLNCFSFGQNSLPL
jgi:hypothetical protein